MLISLYHTLFTLLMLLLLWRRVVIVAAAADAVAACRWLALIYFDFVARFFSLFCVCVVHSKWTEQICAYTVHTRAHTRSFIHGNADISLASKLCQRKKKNIPIEFLTHIIINIYFPRVIIDFFLSLALVHSTVTLSHCLSISAIIIGVCHVDWCGTCICAPHYTKY